VSAAQIIFRDLEDGRVEVAIFTMDHASRSATLARLTLSRVGELIDLRGIGEQLSSGKRSATDIVTIMAVSDAITLVEGADEMVNSQANGASG